MPTLSEQVDAANVKLDALLAAPATVAAPTAEPVEMTAAEALLHITDELSKGVSTERAIYLKGIVTEIAKNNFESHGEGAMPIKIVNDPTQLKPGTAPIAPVQSLTSATPESNFADNMSAVQKVALIVKMLTDKEELKARIAKSALTEKMAQIKSMFGLTDTDMKDSYDVRWKVGDLISLLQDAIKMENFVSGGGSKDDSTSKAEPVATPAAPPASLASTPAAPDVWPRDMAIAKFDPVKKAYEPEPNVWK